jgi:hypothetical protein
MDLAMNLITGAPTKPRDLAALVSDLKLRAAAGESQTKLFEWLYWLTRSLGISLRHDGKRPAAGQPPAAHAHPDRIILSWDRRQTRPSTLLRAECNGVVIDARAWELLVVPPRAFNPRPKTKVVDRFLAFPDGRGDTGLYDVIRVYDGTVISLYRWTHPEKGPIWCMASSNGYDVSSLKWMGPKTFAELVYELLAAKHPAFAEASGLRLLRGHLCAGDTRLDLPALDPGRCYTFGFRHPNLHPLAADPPAVWNIQMADLARTPHAVDTAGGLPGIPHQAVCRRADIPYRAGAEQSLRLADLVETLRTSLTEAWDIITRANSAPPNAVAVGAPAGIVASPVADLATPPAAAVETQTVNNSAGTHDCPLNYGFILRSRNPAITRGHSDILCESPLQRRVRRLVYYPPPWTIRSQIDASIRMEYIALKAFLTATDRDDFIALFPELGARFDVYHQFVDDLIHEILKIQGCGRASTEYGGSLWELASVMLKHILQSEHDFTAYRNDAYSIVHDFVVRPEYALPYLWVIDKCGRNFTQNLGGAFHPPGVHDTSVPPPCMT